jgi:hypothetical protein
MRWRGIRKTRPDRRRSRLTRVLIGAAGFIIFAVTAVGAYAGVSLYRIDRAVHHVQVPAALLAEGKGDLLTVVKGPHHTEEAYLFHSSDGHTHVLNIPIALAIRVGSHTVPLSSLDVHAPDAIIAGLRKIGIPVSRYIGVDLHMVNPDTSLGRLATGKLSIATLIANPTGTTSLVEQVASHVYLGPGTSVSAILDLLHVPTTQPVWVPTAHTQGNVVLASPYVSVLRHFL